MTIGTSNMSNIGTGFTRRIEHKGSMGRICRLMTVLFLVGLSSQSMAFEMHTMSGERTNFLDRVGDGRWSLILVWSIDCIPCEEQKPMLEAFHQSHVNTDAQVVGIALDGIEEREALQAVIDHHQTSYENLVAFTDVFKRQFEEETGKNFRATPTYLLYSPKGELQGMHAGKLSREALESIVSGS